MSRSFDVAVIGAGASGVLTAVQLHRSVTPPRVVLLDAGARAARGLAYGTPYGAHLLNVPAAKMSAFVEEPDHFLNWLAATAPGTTGQTFAPRHLYGEYLAHVLDQEKGIQRIPGSAVGLSRDVEPGRWIVHLHDGRTIDASMVVLALGNLSPADPLSFAGTPPAHYLRDPWAPGAAQGLGRDAPILLIGTGLTMIDLALALRAEGHRGPIHAMSRHGLLPHAHRAHLPRSFSTTPSGSPLAVLRWLRREMTTATAEGVDWRAVIDGLRPLTATMWQAWSLRERRSFLRHARAFWDVHRHRMAPDVATQVKELLEEGTLRIHRGRISAMSDFEGGVSVQWHDADGETREFTVARVINCTGPASNYALVDLPLVAQLRRAGFLVPDPLGLGVETTAEGQFVDVEGEPVPGLFTIGPLRRAAHWESTAIPEIRVQASELARLLATHTANRRRTGS
ncbi:MAG TPA: FAD/NAD(P)-binding protein [Thermoanaerobaculia bacterium]